MHYLRNMLFASLIAVILLAFPMMPTQAGDFRLTNNSGSGSTMWFISGEYSLVMNGFDLESRGLNLPVQLDRVSLSVETPVPDLPTDIVVYQDADGGSPTNATLLRTTQVNITTSGTFTFTFSEPVEITAPVVWVGFYLPVDFEFLADTSGSSVLTYWGWSPGTRFNLTNLGNAAVFGPADGSAPVNIDMNGIARITAELITDGTVASDTETSTTTSSNTNTSSGTSGVQSGSQDDDPRITRDANGRIIQAFGGNTLLSPLNTYTGCDLIYYDTADVRGQIYRDGVDWFCQLDNVAFAAEAPEGYTRGGPLYDVYLFGIESGAKRLPGPVTHCLTVPESIRERAVIGLSHGTPREWEILPTLRYADTNITTVEVICADLYYTGHVSYFTPN